MTRWIVLASLVVPVSGVKLPSVQAAAPAVADAAEAKPAAEATKKSSLEAALDSTTKLQFLNTQLGDVVTILSLQHKIPVVLDVEAIAADGKDAEKTLVTASIQDVSLASALNQLLLSDGMDWSLCDEVLLLTTKTAAAEMKTTRAYSVADLVELPGFDYDRLIDALQNLVVPDDWYNVGGTLGAAAAHPPSQSIVVTLPYRHQRDVAALLRMLTTVARSEKVELNDRGISPSFDVPVPSALDSTTEVQYLDTELADVLADLQLRHHIPIRIDRAALAAAGLDEHTKLSASLKGSSLRAALNRVLEPKSLSWAVVDDMLVLTTRAAAKERKQMQVRLYEVADLVDDGEWLNYESNSSLETTLLTAVTPDEWQEAGGTAAMVRYAPTKSLLVLHHQQGHHTMADLLSQLREVKKQASRIPAAPHAKPVEPK